MAEDTKHFQIDSIIKNDIKNGKVLEVDLEAEYSANLLRNLKAQYDEGILCDRCLIAADGMRISVHQNVLMASSRYFDRMLSSGMTESATDETLLRDINGEALRLLIDFCYSGKVKITPDNIEILLAAASRYEFVEIERQCSKFLEQCLNANPLNCLAYYFLVDLYSQFHGLKNLCKTFLCKNFMKLKDTEEFRSLKFDHLLEAIKCNELNVPNEKFVFNAVMIWINHEKDREKFMVKLYEAVRFDKMETSFIINELLEVTWIPEVKQIFKNVLLYKTGMLESKPVSLTGYPSQPRDSYAPKPISSNQYPQLVLDERFMKKI